MSIVEWTEIECTDMCTCRVAIFELLLTLRCRRVYIWSKWCHRCRQEHTEPFLCKDFQVHRSIWVELISRIHQLDKKIKMKLKLIVHLFFFVMMLTESHPKMTNLFINWIHCQVCWTSDLKRKSIFAENLI